MYEYCTTPLHQSCTDQSQCPGEQPHCCAGRCVCDDQCNVENSVSCTANGLCDDPNDVPGTCAGGSTRLDRRKTCGCGIQKVPTSCTHLSAFVLPEEERATRSTSRLIKAQLAPLTVTRVGAHGTLHQSCAAASECPTEQPNCCAGRCVCDDLCSVENSVSCTANGLCDDPNDIPSACAGGFSRLQRNGLPPFDGEGWLRQTIFDFPSSRIGGSVAAATPTFEGDIKGIYIAQRYLPDQAVREVCRYAQRSVGA